MGYCYLRAAACIAVVTLHTVNVAEILYRDQLTTAQLTSSLAVVYALMWAVPCFVMVSGALLLDADRSVTLEKIFKKYLLRVFGALLLFGLVFRGFDMVMDHESFTLGGLLKGFANVFTGESWAHMWYLYLMIGIYLLLPFYRMIAEHSSKRLLRYLLVIYIIFLSLLPLTKIAGVTSGFYLHVSTVYPFYLFAGFAIANGTVRLSRPAAAVLTLAATAATIGLTCCRYYLPMEGLDQIITSYSSIFVILQGTGLFSLFLTAKQKKDGPSLAGRFLLFLDENSFGIYLVHMIGIRLTLRYWGMNPYETGLWLFPVLIIGNLILSAAAVHLLRKVPVLKRIL